MSAEDFRGAIFSAIASYRRPPGHSTLERLHAADVGLEGIETLRLGLGLNGLLISDDLLSVVSLRGALRAHLYRELQWYLMCNSHALGPVVDGYFSCDLGL